MAGKLTVNQLLRGRGFDSLGGNVSTFEFLRVLKLIGSVFIGIGMVSIITTRGAHRNAAIRIAVSGILIIFGGLMWYVAMISST